MSIVAISHGASGRKDAAREHYRRIVTTYPDTKHAAEARAKLARL